MSDTTKLILAIVVVVIVVAVIIGFVLNARKRREMEHRRFEAGELRAKIEQQAPVLREHDDRASVTSEIAASARSDADLAAEAAERKAAEATRLEEEAAQKDEEARRLEKHAAGHATAAEEARTSAAALAREADRLDPDVRTDDEGNRLDDRTPEDPASAPFLRDDDEPDLADAENPFAPPAEARADESSHDGETMSVSEEGMGTKEASDSPTDESRDDVSNDDTTTPDTSSAGTAGDGTSRTPDTATSESSWQGSSATGAAAAAGTGAAAGWASRGDDDDSETDAAPDSSDLDATGSATQDADGADSGDSAQGPGTTSDGGDSSVSDDSDGPRLGGGVSAMRDEDQRVSVPALDDRDEFVSGSGTPADDPGDHRGQPWATTTGEQPPGADTEEGGDTHSAPVGGGQQTVPTANSDEFASDQTAADDFGSTAGSDGSDHEGHDHSDHEGHDHSDHEGHDHSDHEGHDHSDHEGHDHSDDSDDGGEQQDSQASAGRRVSDFEEVRDGGYGVGSAAPLGDGAQPLGHEVKASREGGTFLTPGDEGYDDREPDVWFYDEDAARRSGFRRSGE